MEVKVWLVQGEPCIRFESYMEDSGQTVEFAVPAHFSNADTLTFSFKDDGWGIAGDGVFTRVGKKARITFKNLNPKQGINALRNYPSTELLPRVKAEKTEFLSRRVSL
jgi:hypothetical protein